MQRLMQMIYDKWTEIKQIREVNRFKSSAVKLQVRTFKSADLTNETEFFLGREEQAALDLDLNGGPLP